MLKNTQNPVLFNSIQNQKIQLTNEFKCYFPTLSDILEAAICIELTINNNQRFRQFIWSSSNKKNDSMGWLCQLSHQIPTNLNVLPEHLVLHNVIGNLQDSWGNNSLFPNEKFLGKQLFLFGLNKCHNGFESQFSDEDDLDLEDLLTFAVEANGDSLFYQKTTKKVFLYAPSGYSDWDIIPIKNTPKNSLFHYLKMPCFIDVVETLAKQWQHAINHL